MFSVDVVEVALDAVLNFKLSRSTPELDRAVECLTAARGREEFPSLGVALLCLVCAHDAGRLLSEHSVESLCSALAGDEDCAYREVFRVLACRRFQLGDAVGAAHFQSSALAATKEFLPLASTHQLALLEQRRRLSEVGR